MAETSSKLRRLQPHLPDDLAKAGAYNASQKKRITALAAIRNSAAHGKPEEFTTADVKGMIDDVERFLATTLQ